MLCNFLLRVGRHARGQCGCGCRDNSVPTAAASTADHPNNRVGSIFRNHIWWVDHVELFAGILSSESEDGQFSTRVLSQEIGDIQNLAIHDNPAIAFRGVLCNLVQGVTSTATATGCCGCCSCHCH